MSISEAVAALRAGDLVILPTETVYGLAADAGNAKAVAAIYHAKDRPPFNPLIVHVTNAGMAAQIAELDGRAIALIAAFWPGPLTLVAPTKEIPLVCDLARAGLDTVAVRAPQHPEAQGIIEAFGRPIVAPSANRSGRPSPTTFEDAWAETGAFAAHGHNGGPCRIGVESTVVSVLPGQPVRLLRPGAVTRAQVEAVAGEVAEAEADAKRSPGRLTRHYAPRAPLRINATAPVEGETFLAFGAAPTGGRVFNLSPASDLDEAAANLFSMLRAADREQPAGIAVAPIPHEGLGEAINDRLARAAGFMG